VTGNDEWLFHVLCDSLAQKAGTRVEYEYQFHPKRRWRFDVAFPDREIAAEIDGGVFANGRHTRGVGFTNDCVKINTATLMGWRVFRFTTEQLREGTTADVLEKALGEKRG
jgi:hypothetical protein